MRFLVILLAIDWLQRPFLADPFFVKKASQDKADEINSCIGCNQVLPI